MGLARATALAAPPRFATRTLRRAKPLAALALLPVAVAKRKVGSGRGGSKQCASECAHPLRRQRTEG